MLAIELPERTGEETARITTAARERGLVLLSCGIYGNVIRLLPPLTISDEELGRGLDILEACLVR
jgi:4-aminobutyrate aminotransferase-like enzyme